jgi:hypothetical protein
MATIINKNSELIILILMTIILILVLILIFDIHIARIDRDMNELIKKN